MGSTQDKRVLRFGFGAPVRVAALGAVILTSLVAAATVSAQEATPGSQWLTYNNRLDGQRFSPLKDITPANASRLAEVCRVQVDGPTTFHSGLVVVDGVIYTNTGSQTIAIDAATCAVRWKTSYTPDEDRTSPSTRGLAVMNGRVFRGTGDARLLALDAATGKLLWKNVIGAPRLGESASAAPLAWQGVVYMAIAGSELGARGRVMAYDAETGKEIWRFNTIPMGKEIGAETWKRPETAKTGGGGVWGAMTLDVTTGELFVPVGNAWPDIDKAYRPGANLFTSSIVSLDARTGELKWWYQSAPEDWQDLDLVAPPVLYRDSKIRDVLTFGGKDGYVTALDRTTHKPIFRAPVTTIVQAPKNPTPEGIRACPGYAGGVEWNGPALDRLNNQLITGAVDACFLVKLGKTQYKAGEVDFGGTVEPDGPVTGWVTAVDSETGVERWKYHAEMPVVAGVTPTAGGVTITGDLAGNLLVFNSKTGELVHKAQTRGAMAGGVVTYEVAGRQYVAFASGNVSRNAFGALGVPSVVVMALNGRGGAGSVPGASGAGSASSAGSASTASGSAAPASGASTSPIGGPGRAGAGAGAPNLASGRKLYNQVCVACHGPDGNLIADHKLGTLKARRDADDTIRYIKDPKAPMPKMFPDLIDEQAVVDVTAYVRDELGKISP